LTHPGKCTRPERRAFYGDWSDASVSHEEKDEQFQEADNDSTLLNLVRDALPSRNGNRSIQQPGHILHRQLLGLFGETQVPSAVVVIDADPVRR